MYDSRLSLLGSIYGNNNAPIDNFGRSLEPQGDTWTAFQQRVQTPSVTAALTQKKESNIPKVGSVKQAVSSTQVQPNNPSIGYLGDEGNWVSALTGLTNNFLAVQNQKNAEDKQLLGQVIQGLGQGVGGMAMSDKRLKENIKAVGKLDNGLTVYLFNFKGQDTPQIGLIAQEVKEVIPEAVTEGEDGYLRVDYKLATQGK